MKVIASIGIATAVLAEACFMLASGPGPNQLTFLEVNTVCMIILFLLPTVAYQLGKRNKEKEKE
jgi:hypothetical protein